MHTLRESYSGLDDVQIVNMIGGWQYPSHWLTKACLEQARAFEGNAEDAARMLDRFESYRQWAYGMWEQTR